MESIRAHDYSSCYAFILCYTTCMSCPCWPIGHNHLKCTEPTEKKKKLRGYYLTRIISPRKAIDYIPDTPIVASLCSMATASSVQVRL